MLRCSMHKDTQIDRYSPFTQMIAHYIHLTFIYIYMYIRVYICIHTHTHAHTHMARLLPNVNKTGKSEKE